MNENAGAGGDRGIESSYRGSAAGQVDVDNTGRSLDQDAATTSFNALGTTELDEITTEGSVGPAGSNVPIVPHDLELMDTDEDSTYASMDEDGAACHSPLKPLEPLSLSPEQSGPLRHNDIGTNFVQHGPPGAADTSQRPPGHYVTHLTSNNNAFKSDSDVDQSIDGFIIDDVGQKQAQKRRKIDATHGKKIQRRISVQGEALINPSRRKRPTGPININKSRLKKQTRITTSYNTAKPVNKEHGFQVNLASCSRTSSVRSSETLAAYTDFDRSEDITTVHSGRGDSSRGQSTPLQPAAVGVVMRIRVTVEKEFFLIPCANSSEKRTVSWLADQVCLSTCINLHN